MAATNKSALTRVNRRDMAARGLYKATDGSWRQADAKKGVRLLYKLQRLGCGLGIELGEHFPDRPQRRGERVSLSAELVAGIVDQVVDFFVARAAF